MKKTITGFCAASVLSMVVALAAAQTPPPQTPPYPGSAAPAAAQENKTDKSVTLTGCLQNGDRPNTFILTNITGDTAASSAAGR